MENRSIDYRRPSSTMIAVEHYRDGQSNDSNPSFTLYLDWTLYIFLYFVISSPPLICGKVEVPNKTWKSAEHYHVLEIHAPCNFDLLPVYNSDEIFLRIMFFIRHHPCFSKRARLIHQKNNNNKARLKA